MMLKTMFPSDKSPGQDHLTCIVKSDPDSSLANFFRNFTILRIHHSKSANRYPIYSPEVTQTLEEHEVNKPLQLREEEDCNAFHFKYSF